MMSHLLWMLALSMASLTFEMSAVDQSLPQLNADVQEVRPVDSRQLLMLLQQQLSAIRANDLAKAYHYFTSKDFKQSTSLEDFAKFIKKFGVLSKNKSLKIYALYFENNSGTLQGLLTSDTGETLKVEYDLVEEEGKWKIIGIQLFKNSAL